MTEPEKQTDEIESGEGIVDKAAEAIDAAIDGITGAGAAAGDLLFGVAEESDAGSDEVTSLTQQLADAEKRVLMAHADLENFRRRKSRETQDQLKYASSRLMTELLDTVDNLNRAIESGEGDSSAGGWIDGVKLVAEQISTILGNHGCKKIEALGQPFDPNLHQAVQMQSSEDYEANTVMMEMRSGYQLHDRVLRPAQVFVSTGPEK
ncbi:MAG: nucleotide exchange factor GrpE [Planctomycetota bacterium]